MTTKLTKGEKYDTDTLNLTGWTGPHDGLFCWDYFSADGEYLGADDDGVEPLFTVAEAKDYPFATDSEHGTIKAADWESAKKWLYAQICDAPEGAWGWIENLDGDRYEIKNG